MLDNWVAMFERVCGHPNLKILDKKLEINTYVRFSENQPWEHHIWEFRKIDYVPLRLFILPKTVCYSQQIHTRVTKILDNKATYMKNEFFFIITIEQKILIHNKNIPLKKIPRT